MNSISSDSALLELVRELCALPHETEWLEFKHNNGEPEEIGQYISALANSAALHGKSWAYMVWGVEDVTHKIVGTTFSPSTKKKGNEPLEPWLLRLLSDHAEFSFRELQIDGKRLVMLNISAARGFPVTFQGEGFIRIGQVKKKLKDIPGRERGLWQALDRKPFEDLVAEENVTSEIVLKHLNYPAYFQLAGLPLPDNRDGILNALHADRLINKGAAGHWDILNLGAILFANDLKSFPSLQRKAVRVIQYRGPSKVETVREQLGGKGYAAGFAGLIEYINVRLPANEVIGQAFRSEIPMYPTLAIRELVANALIHQDFLISGTGPTIEIFDGRIEITNPGEPLVDIERFLGTPPRSRNESLASRMRRFQICEERGSGIAKVISEVEVFQLPPPLFERPEGFTRVVLFSHKPMAAMEREERIRACYQHACLRYFCREHMTNSSVRTRFGIEQRNSATASRLIREALEAKVIRPYDEDASRKFMKYVPFWA